MSDSTSQLSRRLGLADAVFIGLGSMIGAGVFAAFAPAAQAAGSGLLIGLVIAAVIAFCNATASAQLAAAHPVAGGTYAFARRQLGPWWGFFAGWSFVIGKTASCAAMALTFAAYAVPPAWQKPVAILAVVALTTVNYVGVSRTARAAKVIVIGVLVTLGVVVVAGIGSNPAASPVDGTGGLVADGWYGILQSAGLLFFAFAGYARIATLGEEVRNPDRTIPRAIVMALAITVVIYGVVAVTSLMSLGTDGLAASAMPLADVVRQAQWGWALPIVHVGAAAASLGALLALIAGVGRTTFAMAREGDLPRYLSAVHPRFGVPHRAELVLSVVVIGVVLAADLRAAIGFSSFGVLLYYFVTNLAAWTQDATQRRYPRALQAMGAAGCLTLVATLPITGIMVGLGVLIVGLIYRIVMRGILRSRADGT